MKVSGIIAAATLAVSATAANAITVDFSENFGAALADNDRVSTFDFGGGLTGSLQAFGGIRQAHVLDTNSGSRGVRNDPDLASPFRNMDDPNEIRDFGNALIIQENRRGGADDNARGGRIVFTFDNAIDLLSLVFLDGEEGATVTVDGRQVGNQARGADNRFDVIDTSGLANSIRAFTVNFGGSGAIGEFTATPVAAVPLPASLPLALGAVASLAFMSRRRKRA